MKAGQSKHAVMIALASVLVFMLILAWIFGSSPMSKPVSQSTRTSEPQLVATPRQDHESSRTLSAAPEAKLAQAKTRTPPPISKSAPASKPAPAPILAVTNQAVHVPAPITAPSSVATPVTVHASEPLSEPAVVAAKKETVVTIVGPAEVPAPLAAKSSSSSPEKTSTSTSLPTPSDTVAVAAIAQTKAEIQLPAAKSTADGKPAPLPFVAMTNQAIPEPSSVPKESSIPVAVKANDVSTNPATEVPVTKEAMVAVIEANPVPTPIVAKPSKLLPVQNLPKSTVPAPSDTYVVAGTAAAIVLAPIAAPMAILSGIAAAVYAQIKKNR